MSIRISSNGVIDPHNNDVLFGRGNNVNRHLGNLNFRKLCRENKAHYAMCSKLEKKAVSVKIVNTVKKLDPPGRFLRRNKEGKWVDVGDQEAREKTSQALRDCLPEDEALSEASDPKSNVDKKMMSQKGHFRKQTAPGRIQTTGTYFGGIFDFNAVMGPGSFAPGVAFSMNPMNANRFNTIGGFPMPTSKYISKNQRRYTPTDKIGVSSTNRLPEMQHQQKSFTTSSSEFTSITQHRQHSSLCSSNVVPAPSNKGQNQISFAVNTTRSALSATPSSVLSNDQPNQNLASDANEDILGELPQSHKEITQPTSIKYSRLKRGHNRKRTAPGRIETDDLRSELADYSDPFIPIPIHAENSEEQRLFYENASLDFLTNRAESYYPSSHENNNNDSSFMQNSPQLGDNHVVNPKIERNANTFSMSSIKVYHEPKAKDLHTYQAEKIDHGLMAKDLHVYQTEKYRKRHIRKTTAPGRIQNDDMFLDKDDVGTRVTARDEIELEILKAFASPVESNQRLFGDMGVSDRDVPIFSTGALGNIRLSKRSHRRKASTPGRIQHVNGLSTFPNSPSVALHESSSSPLVTKDVGFESSYNSNHRRKYFTESFSENISNRKNIDRSCRTSISHEEGTMFRIKDTFETEAHTVHFSSDTNDFILDDLNFEGIGHANLVHNSEPVDNGTDELIWAEACDILNSNDNYQHHTQQDVSVGVEDNRISLMNPIEEEIEEELMQVQESMPFVHEQENSSYSTDLISLARERENSSCSIEFTSDDLSTYSNTNYL